MPQENSTRDLPIGKVRYFVQIVVDEQEYNGADEVISAIDAYLPGGMDVISAEIETEEAERWVLVVRTAIGMGN